MHKNSLETFDVAIVGYGPVGAALAALLGQRGHRVAVFDKTTEIYPLPRAFALDHEAMRTFQKIGIARGMVPTMAPYRPTLYLGVDGEPIQHFDMGPPPYPLGWAPAYTFNQPALETSLRAAVQALPSVTVLLGQEVVDVRQTEGCAILRVAARDGAQQDVHARYVVACDGGASPMRKRLGLRLKSLEFVEPWIVVDVHVHASKLAQLPATNVQTCNPARPCTYVVGPGTHRRWEFLLLPDEVERGAMPHAAIWALLSPWLRPEDAQIWRAATYRFHAVVLEQWRSGPVLLAGDAAHQMPPFLAQGMCQGLRDAVNLAWKLDWVLAGRVGDALLDSYGQERGPQVEAITATVKRLGKIICERDADRARTRDQRLRDAQGGQVRMQLRQNLLPGIHHGLIDQDAAPPAGLPFPQPKQGLNTSSGKRARIQTFPNGGPGGDQAPQLMDDLVGSGFRLMLKHTPDAHALALWRAGLAALQAQVVSFGTAAPPAGVLPFTEADGVVADWFARYGCTAALVRPDHVVYGVAAHTDPISALLANACRRLGLTISV